jgi:hypothetical protein
MAKSVEVNLEKPGSLIYRNGNYEYTFPCYEQNNEIVVVDSPTRRRVYLFFGWYPIPRKISFNEKEQIRSHLLTHFRTAHKPLRFFERSAKDGQSFAFHPELFEHRGLASTLLENAGFVWLSDYNSIDVLHNEFGLEVCGICDESKAAAVAQVMTDGFPEWHYSRISHKDYGAERGWRFSIHMFPRACEGGQCVDAE